MIPQAKTTIKQIFRAAGVEVTKRSGRRRTQAAVIEHVIDLGFKPQTVIDVGVGNGTPELYGVFPGATHLLVEPLQEFEDGIKEICKRYQATYEIAAAGATPGKTTINVYPSDMQGSSIYGEAKGEHPDGSARTVPVVTLDQLCAQKGLAGPYLVKVDAQGAELDVLNGASKTLADTELVLLEVSFFEFFVNGPQFYDVVHYMKERGFVAYDIVDGHNRPLDGALAQVDIAFVKENGMFRKNHSYLG
jgi:FkbM family methyltransferase